MGRIWRGLKLGMKSLLLAQAPVGPDRAGHRLRRGRGDLDAGDRRRLQPRGPGADRGLGRDEHHRPLGQAQRRGPAPGGRPARILNYGLKYGDFDRIVATVPTIRKVLPIREIRKQIRRLHTTSTAAWSARRTTTPNSTCCRIERGRFLTAADNEKYQNYAVLASETAENALPLRRPGRPVGQARLGLLHGRRRHARNGRARRGSAAAWPPRTSTRTCTSRSIPAAAVRREDHQQPVGLDGRPRRRSSPRSRSRSASIDEVRPHGPRDQGGLREVPPQERRRDDRALRPAARGPADRPASSASSWARSPPSRCWSAASAS